MVIFRINLPPKICLFFCKEFYRVHQCGLSAVDGSFQLKLSPFTEPLRKFTFYTPGRACWAYTVWVSQVFWMKNSSRKCQVKEEKKNAHKCLKVFLPNDGAAAAATADDVCRAHLCGYTVSLSSTIIATKSCSDANVWEIDWWFTYFHFCITDRHVSHCRHTVALNISFQTWQCRLSFLVAFTWPCYFYLFRFFLFFPSPFSL